jgi:mannose-1-phosphate guanylyltransferase / mannose-6-phosphate isomerase
MSLVPIILSGGASTRLWPLSRGSSPEPLLATSSGRGDSLSLLARAFARAAALPDVSSLLAITNRDFEPDARDAYASSAAASTAPITYMLEPFGRNTAAAVALGSLYAEATFGADAILLVLPADHLIRDEEKFTAAVASAVALASKGLLVTFGIVPSAPETGYGYLELGDALDIPNAFGVRRFVEKPPLADARRYLDSGGYLWNAGMFCLTAGRARDCFARYAPDLLAAVEPVWQRLRSHKQASRLEIDPALFESVPNISFDFAVMEKADSTAVVRGEFDWMDVGSWKAMADLSHPDAEGNRGQGERVLIATRDTYVYAQSRLVATIGVEGLVIIETPDAVLVASRDQVQRVREVVAHLEAQGRDVRRLDKSALGSRPKPKRE